MDRSPKDREGVYEATTAISTGTSLNKRIKQYNGCARACYISTNVKDQILCCQELLVLSGERIPRRLIFENFISNLPPYSGFSFAIVLNG